MEMTGGSTRTCLVHCYESLVPQVEAVRSRLNQRGSTTLSYEKNVSIYFTCKVPVVQALFNLGLDSFVH